MFLKNYTSEQPVSQTIFKIEQILIRCGVHAIQKEYRQDGSVTALTFTITLSGGSPWPIRVPADVEKALDALWKNYVGDDKLTPDGKALEWSRKKLKRESFRDQAERTAWKIMQDWIEVQMSMIQMQQADWRQVFLPYVWDGKRSYFDRLVDTRFAGLIPEKTDDHDSTETPAKGRS